MVENETQRKILSNCKFFKDGARYSDLKPSQLDNDLYNYHLQHLVEKKFLEKKDQLYYLTEKGKSISTNIDDQTKAISQNYKVSVYLCPVIDRQVLLHRRLKHPQYGYIGLTSGKIRYGENLLDTAEREFFEETGLKADFKIIGNLRQIRKNDQGEVIEDGVFYICYTDQVEGQLKVRGREGEYFWHDLNRVGELKKIFKPSLEIICREVEKLLKGKKDWNHHFVYELQPPVEDY